MTGPIFPWIAGVHPDDEAIPVKARPSGADVSRVTSRRLAWTCSPAKLVAAALSAALITSLLATPAAAQSSAEAAAKAKVLAARLHVLQGQTDLALRRYRTTLGAVTADVNAAVLAASKQRAAERSAATAQGALNSRVRALYVSGGRPGLYAALAGSRGLPDLTSRIAAMRRLVSTGRTSAAGLAASAGTDRTAAVAARTRALASISTARNVGAAADVLQALLDRQTRLLAAADATVRRDRLAEAAAGALRAAQAAAGRATADGIRRIEPLPGSAAYFALYHAAAATCPGLSWALLAAVGQVESGHGRSMGSSSAGAQGPMQFMPGTFAAYAVDGDRDGRTDIGNPADSIYTAAHYLCANSAGKGPAGVRAALFCYNHAQWYVDMVVALAARYPEG